MSDAKQPAILGVGVVVEQNDKFLVVQENQGNKALAKVKLSFSFPSGKVNPEEHPHDAAVREVYEETGYKIKVNSIIGFYLIKGALGIAYKADVTAEVGGGNIDTDIKKVLWMDADAIMKSAMRPANKQVLKDYRAGKSYPLAIISDNR